jgi:C4-dicarboxylate transporter DctM subunit
MILVTVVLLLAFLAVALPIAASLFGLGVILSTIYASMPLSSAMGELAWSSSNSFLLLSIPLFILLGELLLRSGLADNMYDALTGWLSWLPGGLMHSNIAASALFSATCGSSAATAATVGTVALPQAEQHRYNEKLFAGSLAAGGTLGILIPPSINLIIYGAITETSIPRLYLAGVVPGILLSLMFMGFIVAACLYRPAWGGKAIRVSWRERFGALPGLLPPIVIFAVIMGSIYGGLATATESAALGVIATLALVALRGRLTLGLISTVMLNTMRVTAMIVLIIMGAFFLNFVMNVIGLVSVVNGAITALDLSPYMLLLWIVVFYLVLGTFMEELSMMVTTLPIVAPLMFSAGFDPVWFGIIMVMMIQMALITPPVGINLFIIQSIRAKGSVNTVFAGCMPFVGVMLALVAVLTLFPAIATGLPDLAFQQR